MWCRGRSVLLSSSGSVADHIRDLAATFPVLSMRHRMLLAMGGSDGTAGDARSHAPFSRCAKCNGTIRELSREGARGRVPEYTHAHASRFDECTRCGQVYWPGEIYAAAKRKTAPTLASDAT